MYRSRRRNHLLILLIGLIIAVIGYMLLAVPSYTGVTNIEDETMYLEKGTSRSKPKPVLPARAEWTRQAVNPVRDGNQELTTLLKNIQKPREMGVSSNHTSPEEAGQTDTDVVPSIVLNDVDKAPIALVQRSQHRGVKKILTRLGFREYTPGNGDWDVLWNFDIAVSKHKQEFQEMKPTSKISEMPFIKLIAHKQYLMKVPSTLIPKAFEIPTEMEAFLECAKQHPEKLWVQKNTVHRGIEVKSPDEISLERPSIVQEYIGNPLLIDGRRFDIGVYTVITSLSPLRVYIRKNTALFRFCTKRYNPLSFDDIDTYVVRPGYMKVAQIPELATICDSQNATHKQAFNTYARNQGIDIENIWGQFYSIIRKVILYRQAEILSETEKTGFATRQFFQHMRFDFILDKNWNVYLMEANSDVTISYENSHGLTPEESDQLIYNVIRIVGVAAMAEKENSDMRTEKDTEVFQDWCAGAECRGGCNTEACTLCRSCLLDWQKETIAAAYREHVDRGDFRRLFPPPINRKRAINWTPSSDSFGLSSYSDANRMIYTWFIGMCRKDVTWCS